MTDILTHLRNAARACTDTYEVSLSINEVRQIVKLVDAQAAEIKRLRETLKPFADEGDKWTGPIHTDSCYPACDVGGGACNNCGCDPGYELAAFNLGQLRRARSVLAEA